MSSLHLFRKVALAEGISYLLLLAVAMPIKYLFGQPSLVTYIGWVHGMLFVLYIACLVMAWQERKWSFGKVVLLFLASLVPIAPFFVDRNLKLEEGHKDQVG